MPSGNQKRVIIVTGASRGLGRAIALAFGTRGEKVVVNYREREKDADAVTRLIAESGGEAISVRADVTISSQFESMLAEAAARWGTIDVLVNNAGITKDCLMIRMSENDWDNVLDVNLKAAFYGIRAASRIMMQKKNGHIINVSSIVGMHGREGQANYSASKAGLIGLTKACAREFGPFNVRVNAVLPGYIASEMGDKVSDTIRERIIHENALGRFSDPKEVADFIYHLSFMNNVSGQVFNLDSRVL